MAWFEEKFAAVGRGLDWVVAKARAGAHRDKPLVDMDAVREKVDHFKDEARDRGEVAAAWFKRLPKYGTLSVILTGCCVLLLAVVIIQGRAGSSTDKPRKATIDEVAAMSALRAKLSK